MPVTDLHKDVERSTLAIAAEYPAGPSRIWQLWADPQQLERWWGPPSHPATVTEHDLSEGGTVRYFMTGPDGQRYHGGWRVRRVEQPHLLEFEDFFANEDGAENTELPAAMNSVTIDEDERGTSRMTITARYPSPEAMARVLEMGMEEGIQLALSQIDQLLAQES